MFTNGDYAKLYLKIKKRFEREEIIPSEEVVSLKYVKDALKDALYIYNSLLLEKMSSRINKYNKATFIKRLRNANYPKLVDIAYYVYNDGEVLTTFIYDNKDTINASLNDNNELYASSSTLNKELSEDLLSVNRADTEFTLRVLKEFVKEYPGMDYKFSLSSNLYDQKILDGDFKSYIKLNNADSSYATLSDAHECYMATIKSEDFGILYDYIEFYCDELSKKTSINVEELNPFIKTVVQNKLRKEKEVKLEKVL